MARHHKHAPHAHGHSKQAPCLGHHHPPPSTTWGRTFFVAIFLNATFVVVEFAYGCIANSTALVADAGHNLSDVLGLLLVWGAVVLTRKAPSARYTYGLRSTSILAALANSVFLLVVCGGIAWEAVQRFLQPPAVMGLMVTQVAGVGIVINGVSAWLFMKGSKNDLNIRGAYLHMAADALVSLGVVASGAAMMFTGWYWLDPVISLLIVAVIVSGTWDLLNQSLKLALNAVPAHIDIPAVEAYLKQCEGVTGVHDLHIWGVSTTESVLTAHLVVPAGYPGDLFIEDIIRTLKERFSIQHSTLQIEQGNIEHACALHAPATKHRDH